MGFFSRGTQDDANSGDFLDDVDLPSSADLNEDLFSNNDAPARIPTASKPAVAQPQRPARSGYYGIEDAIKLMRALPRDNNEVVVTVVKKTLESTDIQVTDIIDDANTKEDRIRNEHKTLETEIKDLQDQIAKRNHQISDLLKDLKETTDVRQRLQLAMDLDQRQNPQATAAPQQPAPAAQPKAPAANAVDPQAQTAAPNSQQQPPTDQANYDQNARRRAGHRANIPPN